MRVLFVPGDLAAAEERAARGWLERQHGIELTVVAPRDLGDESMADADVIWVHASAGDPPPPAPLVAMLAAERGERETTLLLTLGATALVAPLGLETRAPRRQPRTAARYGLQGWGPHPLFEGLRFGVDSSEADDDAWLYARPQWPGGGRVVAVERVDGTPDAERAIAWEYRRRGARVLCVGAHLRFTGAGADTRAGLERLARNALALLSRRPSRAAAHWPDPARPHAPLTARDVPLATFGGAIPDVETPLADSYVPSGDDPFTLAGRRAVVVGAERSGVREVRIHPLLVLSGLELRIDGEVPEVRSVDIAPDLIVRHLHTRTRFVEERIFVPDDLAAAVLEYRYRRVGKARADVEAPRLELRATIPMRLGAPIAPDALHPLRVAHRAQPDVAGALVVGSDEHHAALILAEGRATVTIQTAAQGAALGVGARLHEPLRLVVLGTAQGRVALARVAGTLERFGVRALARQRAEDAAALRDELLALRSPNSAVDTAVEWAKVRLAACIATSAATDTGAVDGYGAPESASRTRFDAAAAGWIGEGMLACGLRDEARAAIEFLARTQSAGGRVASFVTTAGVARWEDDDATASWLRLVARYVAWTADVESVRELWPTTQIAIERLIAVAHPPPLAIAALEEIGETAGMVGIGQAQTGARAKAAAAAWRRDLPPESATDGDLAREVALPIALGVADPMHAARALDALAGPRYSGANGVRRRPAFASEGDAWALHTGWTALAEFAAHRGDAGYRHLGALAGLWRERCKGAFDEAVAEAGAIDPTTLPDSGVGAAMLVLGLVNGMLGAVPDAPRRRLTMTPHWPREWARAAVARLRVGGARVSVDASEGCLVGGVPHDGVRYRVRAEPAGSATLVLEHPVGGRSFDRVLVDGAEVESVRCGSHACPHVRVTIWLADEREVQFVGARLASPRDAVA